MRKIALILVTGIMVFMFVGDSNLNAQGNVLNVPQIMQEHSQWSWAACCLSIIRYKGGNASQCGLANYAFSRADCCGVSTFDWYHPCNQLITLSAMVSILMQYGVNASSTGVLSWSSIQSYIEGDDPYIIGRSGQLFVGCGYWTSSGTQYVGYIDSWPGEGLGWMTYYSMTSGWFGTIRTY